MSTDIQTSSNASNQAIKTSLKHDGRLAGNISQMVLATIYTTLGMSLLLVIYVGIVLAVHSSLPMSKIGRDGTPVGEQGNLCLFLIIMLLGDLFGAWTFRETVRAKNFQYGTITWSYEIGAKYNLSVAWPVSIKAAILVMGPVMLLAYLPDINIVTYYNLELPGIVLFMIVRTDMVMKRANTFLLKEGIIDNAKADALTRRNSVRRASQAALTIVHEPTTTQNKRHSGIKAIFAVITTLLTFLGYPFTVLTLFRFFGVGGRMAIVLLFHPLIMEFLMLGYRASTGVGTNMLGEQVKVEPMRDLMSVFIIESYLVLIRRIMLCNLGSFQATTIAIIVTGIEETAIRSTIEVSERAKWAHANNTSNPIQSIHLHPTPTIHSNETSGTVSFTSTSPQSLPRRWPS